MNAQNFAEACPRPKAERLLRINYMHFLLFPFNNLTVKKKKKKMMRAKR